MSSRRFFILILACGLLLTLAFDDALAQAPKKRPDITFDLNETPLQKAIKNTHRDTAKKKKDKMPGGEKKDKCQIALNNNDEDGIAKWCDVGKHTSTKLGQLDLKHPDGKSAGKRVVTKMVLEYENAGKKAKHDETPPDKWPATKFKKFEQVKDHLPGPVMSSSGGRGRSRGAAVLPEPLDNNDKDCTDWITGERFGGSGIADGAPDSCFALDGKLLGTLTPLPDNSGCRHRGGSPFFGNATDNIEDDCWDANNALKTTLVESIDEDGPEALDNDGDGTVNEDPPDGLNNDNDCIRGDGKVVACGSAGLWGETPQPLVDEDGPDSIDNDLDGLFGEDPPAVHATDECARLYQKAGLAVRPTDYDSTGQCDITRAFVKFANDKAKAKHGKKIFKANDDGTPNPDETEGVEIGKEERKMSLTESFGIKCKQGTTFIESTTGSSGVCVPNDEIEAAGGPVVAARFLNENRPLTASDEDPVISRVAMMGFTFAPPVIEWGYRIDEEVCVLGICIEVFYARIGYEFDLAIGLRLPVEIEVLDSPVSVIAASNHAIQTKLEPLDFTRKQYSDFCEHHDLDADWFIGSCDRFGFTDFLDEMVPDTLLSPDKKDGDEFVARYSIFAGIIVRVLGIPIINWGIESSLDVPAACTMMRILNILSEPGDIDAQQIAAFVQALMGFGGGSEEGILAVIQFIKDEAGACGTFTTPFGVDEEGDIRPWPFSGSYDIRADCAEALVRGEVINVKGKPRPICTNMILGVSGASLGVGLGLEATLGSNLIKGQLSTSEDASGSGSVSWTKSSNEADSTVPITILPDNYNDADHRDTARAELDDFTYYLNLLQVALKANLQFGGILSPIPDIGSFTIYRFTISGGEIGIPIPQHPGTEPIAINVPVENYGLKVDVKPDSQLVKPGEFGPYLTHVRNIGSFAGDFDNFRIELSNRPDQTGTYVFGIDQNTDHDCRDSSVPGSPCMFRGNPWDNSEDDCYLASGSVRAGRAECINEDPPSTVQGLSREQRDDDHDGLPDEDPVDTWVTDPDAATYGTRSILDVPPYTSSLTPPATPSSVPISIKPFRHPLTRPGVYPFRVTADSVEAKAKNLPAVDPRNNARKDAKEVAFFSVESFFEPQVVVLPNFDGGKPGVLRNYTVEGTNAGNDNDSMSVANTFRDFNQAGCTLTTLGRLPAGSDPNCPYRAVPTAIPAAWTTVDTLAGRFPEGSGLLAPLGSSTDSFSIQPPATWAGMDDTTYEFILKTVSQTDPDEPPATRSFVAKHTVVATKQSMVRYIGLEIDDLTATLVAAENAGMQLGGLKPIVTKPIKAKNDAALASILENDFGRANNAISTCIQLMKAFVKMVDGSGKDLPPALFADLKNRAAAMLSDMAAAEASSVPSTP